MQDQPHVESPAREPVMPLSVIPGQEARVIASVGFLSAASFVMMNLGIPMPGATYLVYEPSDVPALVATFTMGPMAGCTVVGLRNLLRLAVHPHVFGLLFNLLASGCYVAVAGHLYRRWRSQVGAVAALGVATVAQALAMVALNTALLPVYMGLAGPGLTRMLMLTVLPFNLLKGAVNSTLVYLLYKRVCGFFPRL